MTFQSTVFNKMGFGVVGELFTDSPSRVQTLTLESEDAANNVYGRAFTVAAPEGIAAAGAGGILGFAGIMVNPKNNALLGNSVDGPLGPSLTLPNYTTASFCTMGTVIVSLPECEVGNFVVYDDTTGELDTIEPGDDLPTGFSFANAQVDYFSVTDSGLAVITISPALVIPQPTP